MDVQMIAHDMRTPLNALILSLNSARKLAATPEAQSDLLEIAERNARVLSDLVESLLTLPDQVTSAKGCLLLREWHPRDLVAKAMDQVVPLAADKGLHLESEDLFNLPSLVVDGNRIIRVLANLLTNAVKFTPQGGRITVDAKCRSNDGHEVIVFSVIDDGIGVKEEAIGQIFMEGVSIAEPGKRSTGLGLTVCRELVEAHGGRIWVEPNRSKGSVFSFSIPLDLEPLEGT